MDGSVTADDTTEVLKIEIGLQKLEPQPSRSRSSRNGRKFLECQNSKHVSKPRKPGGVTDPVDALLDAFLVGDVGDIGEADWMEAPLERNFERICKQCGAFEMPKFSSQGRLLAYRAFFCGYVFFEFGTRVGHGAKVAPCPSD